MSVKQRLVGAIVLVVAAVVFLPMVFDGPPPDSSATHSVPLALPASQPTVKVDIDSGKPVADGGQTTPAPASASKPDSSSEQPAQAVAQKSGKEPAQATGTAGAQSSPAPAAKKPTLGESPLASKAGWAVQAGSFADPDHAQALASRLKVKGLSAFVQRYEGGGRTLYRVRVGPFPKRVDAERQAPAVAAAAGGPTKVVPTP